MSASTSRTLPPEIAESVSVMALIERGKAEGQIAGDDVRRAFEADQIPATQWKNVLRSLNQILEEEGVTLMVSAAEPKRTRKSVAAKSPAKRTATKTVAAKTVTAKKATATATPAAPVADAPAEDDAQKAAAKKTAPAKKAVAKKVAAKKTTAAAKKTSAKKDDVELIDEEATEETPGKTGDEPEGAESAGFVLSDEDEDDAPAQQVAAAGATADPVKDYLKQIGKVPSSTPSRRSNSPSASRPVCSPRTSWPTPTSSPPSSSASWRSSPRTAAAPRTTSWRPTSVWWSPWPSATPAAACSSWTSSRRATSV